jgi:hypothetical protein
MKPRDYCPGSEDEPFGKVRIYDAPDDRVGKTASDHHAVRPCATLLSPDGADEAGTRATQRRYRVAMAERHDGRIVNTWGDAVIAKFAGVLEAVQCALETHATLVTHMDRVSTSANLYRMSLFPGLEQVATNIPANIVLLEER